MESKQKWVTGDCLSLDDFEEVAEEMIKKGHLPPREICICGQSLKFCICRIRNLEREAMKTINDIKEALSEAGVTRAKIIKHDHLNVTIQVPNKSIIEVNRLVKERGLNDVYYQVKSLWFFQCWFNKFQVINEL